MCIWTNMHVLAWVVDNNIMFLLQLVVNLVGYHVAVCYG